MLYNLKGGSMKSYLRKVIYNMKYMLQNIIILESNPDFSDNSYGVYQELIKRGLNKKYKIVWFVDKNIFDDVKDANVYFIESSSLKAKYYRMFAKYIIDCNKYVPKVNKHQLRIHLMHGEALKLTYDYCEAIGEIDYVCGLSDFFKKSKKDLFKIEEDKMLIVGFPRNDVLVNKDVLLEFYPEIKREKTILWMPTYRSHKNKDGESTSFKYGVPSINTKEELKELNKVLKEGKVLLLIKLHPAEKDNEIHNMKLSNIKMVSNDIFLENHTNIYQYLASTDALITDYSSIYYDYMLVNKPIGMAIEDIEEYRKKYDILHDNMEEALPAEYIYNYKDLVKFVKNIAKGKDVTKKRRNEMLKVYHKYTDGLSGKRIVDMIEGKNEKSN